MFSAHSARSTSPWLYGATALLGFLIGSGLTLWILRENAPGEEPVAPLIGQQKEPASQSAARTRADEIIVRQQTDLRRLEEENQALQQQLEALRNQVVAVVPRPSSAVAPEEPSPQESEEEVIQRMASRIGMRIGFLTQNLQLTPGQEESFAQIYQEIARAIYQRRQARETGQPIDDLPQPWNLLKDPRLSEAMSESQYSEYEASLDRWQRNQAETATTMRLGQIDTILHLSDQQKDEAYKLLYPHYWESPPVLGNMRPPIHKILGPILTPEQKANLDKLPQGGWPP